DPVELDINDYGEKFGVDLMMWAVLLDKEYNGVAAHIRAIHPKTEGSEWLS
ncbi:hypothetical protein H310_15299, partial [Aphanomyces invadans]